MRKAGNFGKSFVVLLVLLVLQLLFQLVSNLPLGIDSQQVNFGYGLLCVLIFGRWYGKVFVAPFRKKKSPQHPRGFSFHTVVAVFLLGVGLQYVTRLIVAVTAMVRPEWLTAYNALMSSAGYDDASIYLIVYSVLLAPVAEELIFRGLIFRYARYAFPFWVANVYQALLFGVIHGNYIQGIYAFVMGLVFGFVAHRGRGIKYSAPVHVVFNAVGYFYAGLIEETCGYSFYGACGVGCALSAFALWLFYTDFIAE